MEDKERPRVRVTSKDGSLSLRFPLQRMPDGSWGLSEKHKRLAKELAEDDYGSVPGIPSRQLELFPKD